MMGLRAAGLLAAALASLAAAEPWQWLPRAAYREEPLVATLRGGGWKPGAAPDEIELSPASGTVNLLLTPERTQRLELASPTATAALRLVRPGSGAGLVLDAAWELRQDGEPAVLVVPRREAREDRRWRLLRLAAPAAAERCDLELAIPPLLPRGRPALLAQLASAQQLPVKGRRILVRLDGRDRQAAWKHREWRQSLSWLLDDLAERGAGGLVLVEPLCPAPEEPLIAPLRILAREVARAYAIPCIGTAELGDERWWQVAPGVLGEDMNPEGRAALAERLSAWLR